MDPVEDRDPPIVLVEGPFYYSVLRADKSLPETKKFER
jgi:hypothetical protein